MNIKPLLLFIILSIVQSVGLAQLSYPYFQNFESSNFINEESIHLDVNGPTPLPRDETNITFGYNYSWLIEKAPQKNSNALKLTVHPNDHNKQADFPRSRSEIAFSVENYELIFLSYKIFIPDNDDFKETLEKDYYHIIQQFQADQWNARQKKSFNVKDVDENGNSITINDLLGVLTLQYNSNDSQFRDLEFWTNDPNDIELHAYKEIDDNEYFRRRKRIKILNGIQKGKWNEIIVKMNFSKNTDEGFYQFWINRKPVVLDSIGNMDYNEFYVSPKKTNAAPFKIKTVNVLHTRDDIPSRMPMLIKIGHYRQNVDYNQSLYIDDFRIWPEFPPPFSEKPGTTKLLEKYCNVKAPENLILIAYDDPLATKYTFRFTNLKNGKSKIFVSDGPAIDMRFRKILKGKKKYKVDVLTYDNFGEGCLINSLKL